MKTIKLSLLAVAVVAASANAMDLDVVRSAQDAIARRDAVVAVVAPVVKPGVVTRTVDAVKGAAKGATEYVVTSRPAQAVKDAAVWVADTTVAKKIASAISYVRTQTGKGYQEVRALIAKYPTHAKAAGAVAATGVVAFAVYKYAQRANMTEEQVFEGISNTLLKHIAQAQKDGVDMLPYRAEVVTFLKSAINSGMKGSQGRIWLFLQKDNGLALSVFSQEDAQAIKEAAGKVLMTIAPNARYAAEREFMAILNKHVAELMDVKDEDGNPLMIGVEGHKPGTIIEHKNSAGKVVAIECVGC